MNRTLKTTLIALGSALGGGAVMVALAGLVVSGTAGSGSDGPIGGLKAPKVGETEFVGRSNCDRAVKQLLRDPGSYERIDAQIVDVKAGEGWVARMDFRSRNGLGGYANGTAYCVFNGKIYRALIDE